MTMNKNAMIAGGVAIAALATAGLPFAIGGTKLLYSCLGIGVLTGATVAQFTCGIRAFGRDLTRGLVTAVASVAPLLPLAGALLNMGTKFLSSTAPRALIGAELFGLGAASTLALPLVMVAGFEAIFVLMGGRKAQAEAEAMGMGKAD